MELTFEERCRRINLLVTDVDGVLTDGSIIYGTSGTEIKTFHVRDGSGLKIWTGAGKKAALLTGRESTVLHRRAAELDIAQVVQGCHDKASGLFRIIEQQRVEPDMVCYIGDDLPDLPAMRRCGLAVAVADACPEAIAEAQHVTRAAGGRGAVREIIEVILRAQGRWDDIVASYRK